MIRSIAAAVSVLLAPSAHAQTARPTLDYASAATIRDTCVTWAKSRGSKVALVVLETHGVPVTLAHMDGVSTGAGEIAQWKATSAAKFGRATADMVAMNPPANMPSAATVAGGIPIYSTDGVLLGGVGVSGGKPTDDVACASSGIEAAGLKTSRSAPPAQ